MSLNLFWRALVHYEFPLVLKSQLSDNIIGRNRFVLPVQTLLDDKAGIRSRFLVCLHRPVGLALLVILHGKVRLVRRLHRHDLWLLDAFQFRVSREGSACVGGLFQRALVSNQRWPISVRLIILMHILSLLEVAHLMRNSAGHFAAGYGDLRGSHSVLYRAR